MLKTLRALILTPDNRLRWSAPLLTVVLAAAMFGVNLFYNEAHEARGLDRATFQSAFVVLLVLTYLSLLAVLWGVATTRDEVVRASDGVSVYWGWAIGAFAWCVTPWVSSLPDALVDPFSNPDGTTVFALSEASGAYLGGGMVLILMVSACSAIIQMCWWLAKR